MFTAWTFFSIIAPVSAKNSPAERGLRKSVRQPHSSLERRLVPFLLIVMAAVMGLMILFAAGIVAGLIQY